MKELLEFYDHSKEINITKLIVRMINSKTFDATDEIFHHILTRNRLEHMLLLHVLKFMAEKRMKLDCGKLFFDEWRDGVLDKIFGTPTDVAKRIAVLSFNFDFSVVKWRRYKPNLYWFIVQIIRRFPNVVLDPVPDNYYFGGSFLRDVNHLNWNDGIHRFLVEFIAFQYQHTDFNSFEMDNLKDYIGRYTELQESNYEKDFYLRFILRLLNKSTTIRNAIKTKQMAGIIRNKMNNQQVTDELTQILREHELTPKESEFKKIKK